MTFNFGPQHVERALALIPHAGGFRDWQSKVREGAVPPKEAPP